LGARTSLLPPPVVFLGVSKGGGGPSYHPAGGRQLGMLSEKDIGLESADTLILSSNYGTYGKYPQTPMVEKC